MIQGHLNSNPGAVPAKWAIWYKSLLKFVRI
jgi:hypothetical protein